MVKKIILIVMLSASSAYGFDFTFGVGFTDDLSKMLLRNECVEAKAKVTAEYPSGILGENYWPVMQAVSNVCVFLRVYNEMDATLAHKDDIRDVKDYYAQEVQSSFAMLSAQPMPLSQELVDSLNAKMRDAEAKVNAAIKRIEAARIEEKRQHEEAQRQRQLQLEEEQHRYQAAIDKREAEKRAERERQEAESKLEREKQLQHEQEIKFTTSKMESCHESKQYQLYDLQETIISLHEQLAGWKENQRMERRISKQSGVVNLTEQYNNGAWIITIRDDIKASFARYLKLGGRAVSSGKVKHSLKNPCAVLEAELEHTEHDRGSLPK